MPQTLDLTELNNVDPNVLNLPTSLISLPRNFVLIHIIHSKLQHYVTTTGEKKRERRKREIFFFSFFLARVWKLYPVFELSRT